VYLHEGADRVGCGGYFTQDGRTSLGRMNILGAINSSGGENSFGNILDAGWFSLLISSEFDHYETQICIYALHFLLNYPM